MTFTVILMSVVFPIAMVVGGYAAWQISKNANRRDATSDRWKDESLEDWRRERDERAEVARRQREERSLAEMESGSEAERAETVRHQRIGG